MSKCLVCADGDHIIHGHELPAVGSLWIGPSGITYRVEHIKDHATDQDCSNIYIRGEGLTKRGAERKIRREVFGYFRRAFVRAGSEGA